MTPKWEGGWLSGLKPTKGVTFTSPPSRSLSKCASKCFSAPKVPSSGTLKIGAVTEGPAGKSNVFAAASELVKVFAVKFFKPAEIPHYYCQ
jgi:hypothetical protein